MIAFFLNDSGAVTLRTFHLDEAGAAALRAVSPRLFFPDHILRDTHLRNKAGISERIFWGIELLDLFFLSSTLMPSSPSC
jgi:hypothetical protein